MLQSNILEKIRCNSLPRLLLLLLALYPLIYFREFYLHFTAYLTGNIITKIITQEWHVVLLSIILFVAFLIPLTYRRKASWAEKGLVTAFFVSLFVEMYGIPLTLLFASKYFAPSVDLPANVINFKLFGVGFGMDVAMAYATLVMLIGATLILTGWVSLYYGVKKNAFVTNGIYAYSRHPQYLGFILVIIGWFIGWPTLLTLIFAPILIYKYVRVCFDEEKEIYPEHTEYRKKVPMFV